MLLSKVYSLLLDRLLWMLRVNHTVVSLTLFSVSGLLSLGFLLGDINISSSYAAYNSSISWFVVFGVYSTIKFVQALGRTPMYLRATNSILGLWLWCYLILAFIFMDPARLAPTEPMLLMPLIWELAYITSLIYIYRRLRSSLARRADD